MRNQRLLVTRPCSSSFAKAASVLIFGAPAFFLSGCAAALLATNAAYSVAPASRLVSEAVKTGKKDQDVVIAPGADSEKLKKIAKVGVNIKGLDASKSVFMLGYGTGGTNAGLYADLIQKEFLRLGVVAKIISDDIDEDSLESETADPKYDKLDCLITGNFNLATTSSTTAAMFGGDPYKTGVTGFSLKGYDLATCELLFIISSEYGVAKGPEEVADDFVLLFKQAVGKGAAGSLQPSEDAKKPQKYKMHQGPP